MCVIVAIRQIIDMPPAAVRMKTFIFGIITVTTIISDKKWFLVQKLKTFHGRLPRINKGGFLLLRKGFTECLLYHEKNTRKLL